jgi:hypothetical protein
VVTKIKVADNHGIKKKESALARKIANQDVVKQLLTIALLLQEK